jgi:hypothetical protein
MILDSMPETRFRSFRIASALVGVALLARGAAPAQDARCPAHLFVLGRNKNANVVAYDARMDANGALAGSKPLEAYWLIGGEHGKRQPLNAIEWSRAYGFAVSPGADPGTLTVRLRADRDRPLSLSVRDGCPAAVAQIGDRRGILRRIFVQAIERGIEPKVEYIELFGEDLETGESLHEKFVP